DLLPLLENDPSYAHFLLDGQLAVVDDYLAVRPEQRDRLERLVGSGRLAVGPWYTLPDEFCVSGETLVRNLQLGMERAVSLGGAMPVGYLPDMFGHVAQMPQLLRLAGFDRAVVWRGVPLAIDRTAFWWSSPDGSTVLAEYLWHGYGNGSSVPDDAKALVERIRGLIDSIGEARAGDLLFMNGTDHERPQPWLGRVVAEANDIATDLDIRITSLAEALAASTPPPDLPRWTGELRSGARANLLMGVMSNRVDVKQAAAAAERALERVAEPLCALWMPTWPGSLLADAWREVIRNAAHDSSCACSIDDVCDAVLSRYRGARHTANALTRRALRALAATLDAPGLIIVNPTARTRGGVVEIELPGEGPAGDTQLLSSRPALLEDRVMDHDEARRWLSSWRSQEIAPGTYVLHADVSVEGDSEVISLALHADAELRSNLLVPAIRAEVEALLGAGGRLHLRIDQPPRRRVLCRIDDVPGYGWTRWDPAPMVVDPVRADGDTLSNGLVTVHVAGSSFTLDGVADLGRLVESGDLGDTYNYCPPDHDTVVSEPERMTRSTVEAGPARGRIVVHASYAWPERADGDGRRVGASITEVVTVVELRAGEPFVRVNHRWDNNSRDHRVRATFALEAPVEVSHAECAFGVVTRSLTAEGGATEQPLATYPSRRFVRAGAVTVVHDGLLEYEVADDTLALTLVRSTGMLSRVDVPTRPLPAGPPIAVEGAQVQGPISLTYAVSVDPTIDPYAMADEVLIPLMTARAPGGGSISASSGRGLVVEGAEVSAVQRDGHSLVVRMFNPTAEPVLARIAGRTGWIVDLRGRPLAPFEERVALGPCQIATLRLAPRPREQRP
ncbi:MAG: glycoside hydrolase family 38 N-terminal domain-containing protein, partial [Acidimicrobiales bacterium]